MRHVEFAADLADAEHDRLQRRDLALGVRVGRKLRGARVGLEHHARAVAAGERTDALPDFLGDERHQWMQHAQRRLQHFEQRASRAELRCGRGVGRLQHGLAELEVPVAVLVPDELVDRLRGEVEAVSREVRAHRLHGDAEPAADPAVGDRELAGTLGEAGGVLLGVHQHVAGRVPQLVAEVSVPLDAAEIEADVAAHGRQGREREAQRIGAVGGNALRELLARRLLDRILHLRLHQPGRALGDQRIDLDAVDQVERVDDVALRLRHLLPVLVADQARDVDLAERHLAPELEAHHDHPGDPEEDDVEAGHEHVGRIERGELRGLARPAERRERPQRRAEPGVEHVLVTGERHLAAVPRSRGGRAPRFRCARRTRDRPRRTTPGFDGPTRAGG